MTYTIKTSSFNARRYGRPWIAEIRGKEFVWGSWDGRNGEAGTLEIDAEPGALIGNGQKDWRKGRGGVDTYNLAMPNGKLWGKYLGTASEAARWAKAGWRAYAEMRMEDTDSKNEIRIEAARMLAVQDPFSRVAAEFFGLVDQPVSTPALPISMDDFMGAN